MPQGSFNISQWIRQLGLKNVTEMPVLERLTPVVQAGNLEGWTPRHEPPTRMATIDLNAVAGQVAAFELQSTALGGSLVVLLRDFISVLWNVRAASTLFPAGGALSPLTELSNEAGVAVVRQVNRVATLASPPDAVYAFDAWRAHPAIYVPRGQFFAVESLFVNVILLASMIWVDFPASEGAD